MMDYNFAFGFERIGRNLRPQTHRNGRRQVALMSTRLPPMAASALEHLWDVPAATEFYSNEMHFRIIQLQPRKLPTLWPELFQFKFSADFHQNATKHPVGGHPHSCSRLTFCHRLPKVVESDAALPVNVVIGQ
jgi:hypothetical protein